MIMSIKRTNDYMMPRTKKSAPKSYICSKCKQELLPKDAYFYVDGCNYAITDNALAYCRECYREVYDR